MTKQELQQLRHLESDLRLLRKYLRKAEAEIGLRSISYDGQPKGSRIGRPTEEQAVQLAHIITKIKEAEKRVLDEKVRAWDFISSLDDSLLRQIIIHRFLDGKSWVKVASEIGGDMTADWCRMYFNRLFKDDDSPIT